MPLLIQNLLDFYRWLIWIQKLHKEYQMEVYIHDDYLAWRYYDGFMFICWVSGKGCYHRKTQVGTYTKGFISVDFVPKRYHFSSGMRDKSGYTDRDHRWFKN